MSNNILNKTNHEEDIGKMISAVNNLVVSIDKRIKGIFSFLFRNLKSSSCLKECF